MGIDTNTPWVNTVYVGCWLTRFVTDEVTRPNTSKTAHPLIPQGVFFKTGEANKMTTIRIDRKPPFPVVKELAHILDCNIKRVGDDYELVTRRHGEKPASTLTRPVTMKADIPARYLAAFAVAVDSTIEFDYVAETVTLTPKDKAEEIPTLSNVVSIEG